MKSQPEIKIRRLAVFGGYRDLEAPTAWHRGLPIDDPSADADEPIVIRLAALPRAADMPVAA